MRVAYYAGASTAAAAACLLKAFHERPNFYSATVYLSQSNACLLILTNLLLICACSMVYALQRLLYGPLRPIEIEQLSEKAWYAVLDTLLAMPSFREDVGGWLLTMFVLLLAGKVWGWIGEGRVDILEQQPPANPRLFHARLANSLVFSVIFDIWMTRYCFETVAADPRPGMMVIFTFEFAILTIFSTFTLCRYVLSLVSTFVSKQQMINAVEERKTEIRAERAAARQSDVPSDTPSPDEPIEVDENEVDVPGWEEKRRWLFGLEMTADFLKLLLYIIFFTVSITFNGLPMHIMRDVYMTFASFTKRLGDYVNYKKATSDMNARYPDATTVEIRDDACIVCREDMIAWQDPTVAEADAGTRPRRDEGLRAKKLPCGHILHLRCLKAWLERQQVCPTCRRPVIAAPAPATNHARVNAPGAAPNVAPAAAPNAPQRRPADQAGARFFNLGPIRIGLLNGPVGQIDNIVNQLRGGQPPQQAGNAQPGAVQQAATAANQAPVQSSVSAPTQDARLSQHELIQFSQRVNHESAMLNVEQAQLATMRAMSHEFDRLMHLHNYHTAIGRAAAIPQPQHVPNGGLIQPSATQMLGGQSSQVMAAGARALPQGLILPEGWTVMPLHRHQQQQPSADMHGQRSVHVSSASAATVPQEQPRAASTPAAEERAVPTNGAGEPLFVPANNAATTTTTGAVSQAQFQPIQRPMQNVTPTATTSAASTAESRPTQRPPWTSDSWDFDAASKGQSAPSTSEEQATQASRSNKGKGRATEIEDIPDSQT